MIVGITYEGGEAVLHHADGGREHVPFAPRMLIPTSLAPYLPHHLEVEPAPGGLYVEAPYTTLLRLYQKLSKLSSAVIFPPPERQFLLLNNLKPFSDGLTVNFPTEESALFHLLRTPSTPNPSLTFLENVLFTHGYARPLKRVSRINVDHSLFYPFFQFNVDSSTFSHEGILLPTSPVEVEAFRELHSIHPLINRKVLSGRGIITLADAHLYGLKYRLLRPLYTSKDLSFLHREILSLFVLLSLSIRSSPRELLNDDPTTFNYLVASWKTLAGLPDLLINTYVLGVRGRNTLLALYNLLRRDPKVYNDLSPSIDTCCPGLRELVSYLPALSSLLTEPLRL